MRINYESALRFWEECFGARMFAEDFHGNLMYKYAYGDSEYFANYCGKKIYCGWNIHHILPVAHGGTNVKQNLICTNIITNDEAADKITFWIDDCLYQVKRTYSSHEYKIFRIRQYGIMKQYFDYDSEKILTQLSEFLFMDSDGNLFQKMGDDMVIDEESGDLHMISPFFDDGEDK